MLDYSIIYKSFQKIVELVQKIPRLLICHKNIDKARNYIIFGIYPFTLNYITTLFYAKYFVDEIDRSLSIKVIKKIESYILFKRISFVL